MAKRKQKLTNGVDLTLPTFLDRKNPKTIALVEKGLAAHKDERRASSERRAAEAVRISNIAAAARKVIKKTPAKKSNATKPVAKPEKAEKGKMSPDATITVLVDSFPHRAGSQAETKSALLKTGMTVAEYQAAGAGLGLKGNWHIAHIKYCVNYNLIKVS